MTNKILISFYAIRNQKGQYFRAKGWCGEGPSWVDGLEQAKIYGKISPARGVVTWFAGHHPKLGIPDIVELQVTEAKVLLETDRVKKSVKKSKELDLNRSINHSEHHIKCLKEKIDKKQYENELKNKKQALSKLKSKLKKIKSDDL